MKKLFALLLLLTCAVAHAQSPIYYSTTTIPPMAPSGSVPCQIAGGSNPSTWQVCAGLPPAAGGTGSTLEAEIGRFASSFLPLVCDGTTDNNVVMNAALAYGYLHNEWTTFPNNLICAFTPPLLITQGQQVNFNFVKLLPIATAYAGGLNPGTAGNSCAIQLTGTSNSVTQNISSFILNGTLLGPNWNPTTGRYNLGNSNTLDGFCETGLGGGVVNAHLMGWTIIGFRHGLTITGPNVFINSVDNSVFYGNWRDNVMVNCGANACEALRFNNDNISNSTNSTNSTSIGSDQYQGKGIRIVDGSRTDVNNCPPGDTGCSSSWTNTFVEVYLDGGSVDYNDGCAYVAGGIYEAHETHHEDNTANPCIDAGPWANNRAYPKINLVGGVIGTGPNSCPYNCPPTGGRAATMKYESGNDGHYSFIVDHTSWAENTNESLLVDAAGTFGGEVYLRPRVRGSQNTTGPGKIFAGSSMVANRSGGIASGSGYALFQGWMITGGVCNTQATGANLPSGCAVSSGTWSQVTTTPLPPDDTTAIQVSCASSCSDHLVQQLFGWTPGQSIDLRAWLSATVVTSGSVSVDLLYYNGGPNPVTTDTVTTLSAVTAGAIIPNTSNVNPRIVPPGTTQVFLEFKTTTFVGTAQFASADAWPTL